MTEQLSGYVMADTESSRESDRLALLEATRDRGTIVCLEALCVGEGWRCLEVGAGRGSIARWLADRVGPTGSAVAADIDPRFLTAMPPNVEVRALDIRDGELERGAFDLVHCRVLLMHLPDPGSVLERLAGALLSGGVLLAEEGDYGLYQYGGRPNADELTALAHRALQAVTQAGVMDAFLGRRLPAMLADRGLELLGAQVDTPVSRPGDPAYEFARASALDSLPRLIAAGAMPDADLTRLQRFYADPGSLVTGPSLVSAWGSAPREEDERWT